MKNPEYKNMIEFEENTLREVLQVANEWITANEEKITDMIVTHTYPNGFDAWQVRIYYR